MRTSSTLSGRLGERRKPPAWRRPSVQPTMTWSQASTQALQGAHWKTKGSHSFSLPGPVAQRSYDQTPIEWLISFPASPVLPMIPSSLERLCASSLGVRDSVWYGARPAHKNTLLSRRTLDAWTSYAGCACAFVGGFLPEFLYRVHVDMDRSVAWICDVGVGVFAGGGAGAVSGLSAFFLEARTLDASSVLSLSIFTKFKGKGVRRPISARLLLGWIILLRHRRGVQRRLWVVGRDVMSAGTGGSAIGARTETERAGAARATAPVRGAMWISRGATRSVGTVCVAMRARRVVWASDADEVVGACTLRAGGLRSRDVCVRWDGWRCLDARGYIRVYLFAPVKTSVDKVHTCAGTQGLVLTSVGHHMLLTVPNPVCTLSAAKLIASNEFLLRLFVPWFKAEMRERSEIL
ncbi:hypothetical protein C8R44DRAFT_862630 [Mycena epipterygia]|nr:hypothetical protein C8R44DRAFT_862630 [Mycena epipterygia]